VPWLPAGEHVGVREIRTSSCRNAGRKLIRSSRTLVSGSTGGPDVDTAYVTPPKVVAAKAGSKGSEPAQTSSPRRAEGAATESCPLYFPAFTGKTNDLLMLSDSLRICISVTSYLVDQVVEAGVAAVGNAFEPAQCLALVAMFPCQSHQVLLHRRKLGAP